MNPTTVQNNVNTVQSQGAQNQAALNAQTGQLKDQYGNAVNQANTAQTNATNAANAIQDGGDLYAKNLATQQQSVGFNPLDLTTANKNLTAMQNQVAAAPMTAQQTGNYYGTTAGGTGNIYAGLMSNLNPGLTNATNSVGNLTNEYGQLTNAANQQTGLTVQSEQNKATDLATIHANAVSQMQSAGQTMAAIEALQQQQGYVTAQAAAQYQNAYSQYISAQAAATSAAAAMTTATANAGLTNAQTTAQLASNAKAAAVANATKPSASSVIKPTASKPQNNTVSNMIQTPSWLSKLNPKLAF